MPRNRQIARKRRGIADWVERREVAKAASRQATMFRSFWLNAPGSTPETVAMIRRELAAAVPSLSMSPANPERNASCTAPQKFPLPSNALNLRSIMGADVAPLNKSSKRRACSMPSPLAKISPATSQTSPTLDLRRLQDEWDREGLEQRIRLLRRIARRQPDIDRFTAWFAYAVLAAAALVAIFHTARYAARVWGAA